MAEIPEVAESPEGNLLAESPKVSLSIENIAAVVARCVCGRGHVYSTMKHTVFLVTTLFSL